MPLLTYTHYSEEEKGGREGGRDYTVLKGGEGGRDYIEVHTKPHNHILKDQQEERRRGDRKMLKGDSKKWKGGEETEKC